MSSGGPQKCDKGQSLHKTSTLKIEQFPAPLALDEKKMVPNIQFENKATTERQISQNWAATWVMVRYFLALSQSQ